MDIQKLNSATKYPSILSYHQHGQKGLLTENLNCIPPTTGAQSLLGCTEKLNGSNARIILFLDKGQWRFVIGSRETLLYTNGDFLLREEYSIVETLLTTAERLQRQKVYAFDENAVTTFYSEVFGDSSQPESKNYTDSHSPSFRLFDVSVVDRAVLDKPVEEIAAWRERGGQQFLDEMGLQVVKNQLDLTLVPGKWGVQLPTTIEDTYKWLCETMPETGCLLDSTGKGKAEGVVVRNSDRSFITKIRFEDYERHFKKLELQGNRK
jgi:hypothetical protein